MGTTPPVVAFAVDGVKEKVVDGETEYLIPFGDVATTVKLLKKCLDDPPLRRRMGGIGRKRVQAMFAAEETSRQISSLICNLLAEKAQL